MDWEHNGYLLSLITRYVDGYTNKRPITGLGASLGYKNKVDSFLVFDISARKSIDLDEGNINFGIAIINALDESALDCMMLPISALIQEFMILVETC